MPSPHLTQAPPDPGGVPASHPWLRLLCNHSFVRVNPSQHLRQPTQRPPAGTPSAAQFASFFKEVFGAAEKPSSAKTRFDTKKVKRKIAIFISRISTQHLSSLNKQIFLAYRLHSKNTTSRFVSCS